jgi:hypothetical protein
VLKGEDGFSPNIEVVKTESGHRITITDKDDYFSFEIKDGINGKDGTDGQTGPVGPQGPKGDTGP